MRYSEAAVSDLEAALEHVRTFNSLAATQLAERVLSAVESLAAGEFEGPEQVLASGERVRSWPVRPLRLYYQRTNEALHVVRIYHQSRRPLTAP